MTAFKGPLPDQNRAVGIATVIRRCAQLDAKRYPRMWPAGFRIVGNQKQWRLT
jgi:hypothetical protein